MDRAGDEEGDDEEEELKSLDERLSRLVVQGSSVSATADNLWSDDEEDEDEMVKRIVDKTLRAEAASAPPPPPQQTLRRPRDQLKTTDLGRHPTTEPKGARALDKPLRLPRSKPELADEAPWPTGTKVKESRPTAAAPLRRPREAQQSHDTKRIFPKTARGESVHEGHHPAIASFKYSSKFLPDLTNHEYDDLRAPKSSGDYAGSEFGGSAVSSALAKRSTSSFRRFIAKEPGKKVVRHLVLRYWRHFASS